MNKQTTIAVIIVAVAFFLLGWSFGPRLANAPANNRAEISDVSDTGTLEEKSTEVEVLETASVMLDFGDGTIKTYEDISTTDSETLFSAMKQLSESGNGFVLEYQPPGEFGVLIDQIGDKRGGEDGKYWLWYENNRMGQVAADRYELKPGDVIEWKFVNLKM